MRDEFDFIIAQSKGTCHGSVTYKCSHNEDLTTGWQFDSGGCSGTCVDQSQSCAQENISTLGPCTESNLGQEASVGCTCA